MFGWLATRCKATVGDNITVSFPTERASATPRSLLDVIGQGPHTPTVPKLMPWNVQGTANTGSEQDFTLLSQAILCIIVIILLLILPFWLSQKCMIYYCWVCVSITVGWTLRLTFDALFFSLRCTATGSFWSTGAEWPTWVCTTDYWLTKLMDGNPTYHLCQVGFLDFTQSVKC